LFVFSVFASGPILSSASQNGSDFSFLESFYQKNNEDPLVSCQRKAAESPDLCIVQRNSIAAFTPPQTVTPKILGQIIGDTGETGNEERKEIVEYVVEKGDSIKSIADKFGVSANTVLWANDLKSGASVKAGQVLVILPVSGVLHHVKKGETLSEIVSTYKAKTDETIAFNELASESDIYIGDILVVPGGILPAPKKVSPPAQVPLASKYFIAPLASYKVTQGLHFYNAVDLSSGKCGDQLFAAAQGQVIKVRYGWNMGGGNLVKILHPNGVVTYYGHMQAIVVSVGQNVSQGQMIGLMGGQPGTPGAGHSTGCHVHFQVEGAKNPFTRG